MNNIVLYYIIRTVGQCIVKECCGVILTMK